MKKIFALAVAAALVSNAACAKNDEVGTDEGAVIADTTVVVPMAAPAMPMDTTMPMTMPMNDSAAMAAPAAPMTDGAMNMDTTKKM